MKVAVLVHNNVLKDARVRKEVATLVGAGHEVDVYGLETASSAVTRSEVEGANLIITGLGNVTGRRRKAKEVVKLLAEVGLAVLGTTLVSIAITLRSHQYIAAFLLLSTIVVANGMKRNSQQRRRRRSIARAIAVSAAIIGGGVAQHTRLFTPVEFILFSITAWIVYRFALNTRSIQTALTRLVELMVPKARVSDRLRRFELLATVLAEQIYGRDYDVVHCHDIIALIAGVKIKRRNRRIKLIWDAHELYEELAAVSPEYSAAMKRIIHESEKFIDGFITISESFKKFYGQNYKLPQAEVVMNATVHAGQVVYDGRLHHAAGLRPEQKILLFQGGFSEHRGISQLMAAATKLPAKWSLVMMGWGNLQPQLENLARELGDGKNSDEAPLVLIPPAPHSDLAKWTAGATIGIIPYENVGLNHLYCTPNKLWEFPNAGVPIVATSLIEMEKMITAWGTGFLLPREFTGDHIVNLLTTLTDEELAVARNNCETFSKQMSWAKFEPRLLRLYESLAL